jgi:ATPase subunit of ABC transporter with duplicated ATPase domains
MIAISNLAKAYGGQNLFSDVSVQLNVGSRYGLVGANGSGKSTLMRILAGDEIATEGEVSIPKKARIGVLRQDHFGFEDVPILDVAMMGDRPLWDAMAEKETLLANADQEFDADRYADLEDFILRSDGYSFESRAAEILEGLGIPTEVHRQPLSTLSGGFKLRVLLAQVLAAKPDVLFLDEPTNHLDILSIRWLEKFLVAFSGCTVVISHDHRFLDNVCTHILDVDYETVMLYHGGYTAFEEQKVGNRERKEMEIERAEKKIAEHQAFVERFRAKATKARQAQSRVKMIEKIVIDKPVQSSRRYPLFQLKPRRPSGKEVLTLEGIAKSYGPKKVLENVTLSVRRGDRLAVIGPNGIGKSTLLKIAMGQLQPDRGRTEWGYEAWPGYFAQDHKEQFGDSKQTVESWLWDAVPGQVIGYVRGELGKVLFSGDDVYKGLGALSGGEAARLVFCRLAVDHPNVLVLDEPTNHLDLEAIDALVEGLKKFDGTLIFVSHDRWFVQQLANRILEITPNGMRDFPGTYDEYIERLGDDHLDADAVLKASRDKKKSEEKKALRSPAEQHQAQAHSKKLAQRRDHVTTEIERAEARVAAINEMFCDPTFFEKNSREKVKKLEEEQKAMSTKTEQLMAEWEALEAELAG